MSRENQLVSLFRYSRFLSDTIPGLGFDIDIRKLTLTPTIDFLQPLAEHLKIVQEDVESEIRKRFSVDLAKDTKDINDLFAKLMSHVAPELLNHPRAHHIRFFVKCGMRFEAEACRDGCIYINHGLIQNIRYLPIIALVAMNFDQAFTDAEGNLIYTSPELTNKIIALKRALGLASISIQSQTTNPEIDKAIKTVLNAYSRIAYSHRPNISKIASDIEYSFLVFLLLHEWAHCFFEHDHDNWCSRTPSLDDTYSKELEADRFAFFLIGKWISENKDSKTYKEVAARLIACLGILLLPNEPISLSRITFNGHPNITSRYRYLAEYVFGKGWYKSEESKHLFDFFNTISSIQDVAFDDLFS